MTGFNNPLVGGPDGVLKRDSIESPNFVEGVSGWRISKDGTAQFNELIIIVQSNTAAILVYAGVAGPNTLIGSWANAAGVDQYGNAFPGGLSALQGTLTGIEIDQSVINSATIVAAILASPVISNPTVNGGTTFEQVHTFDSGGGAVLGYSSTTTTVTQTVNGTYTFTVPTGVGGTPAAVNAIGAGTGGDGGKTNEGGNGGGGGGYSGNPNYNLPPDGTVVTYIVGNGGSGGTTGNASHGDNGGDSVFDVDNSGVTATGGTNNLGGGGGTPGGVNHTGGNGGPANGNNGGAAGGNSANASPTAGTGNSGGGSSGTTGAASPAAQAGSGTGGAGGNQSANGHNGGAPGAGGGGAGAAVGGSISIQKSYSPTWIGSYFGPDGSSPNGLRTTGNPWYQGGETAGGGSFNGNQRTILRFNAAQIASDFAGATITQCTLTVTNQHSWFNGGMTIDFDYFNAKQGGSRLSTYPTAAGITFIANAGIGEGASKTFSFGTGVGALFAANTIDSIIAGARVAGNNAYNLQYYGFFSPTVTLTITSKATTGGGSFVGGAGADGSMSFTYVSGNTLTSALSAVAGTDAAGNAYGAGYTGQSQAFQPGSSPAVVETWHNITLDSGWTPSTQAPQYRMKSDGNVELRGQASHASFTTTVAINSGNPLPTAYRPAVSRFYRASDPADNCPTVQADATGIIQGRGSGSFPATQVLLDGSYSL